MDFVREKKDWTYDELEIALLSKFKQLLPSIQKLYRIASDSNAMIIKLEICNGFDESVVDSCALQFDTTLKVIWLMPHKKDTFSKRDVSNECILHTYNLSSHSCMRDGLRTFDEAHLCSRCEKSTNIVRISWIIANYVVWKLGMVWYNAFEIRNLFVGEPDAKRFDIVLQVRDLSSADHRKDIWSLYCQHCLRA